MATNRASGNDRVALQVGRINPSDDDSPKRDSKKPAPRGGNARTGNAKVGLQTDEIVGDLVIRMDRRA